jgi:ectoine hydroxylase-related dioxygenase (phytanoyl-CoA dioxygenase family)
MLELLPAPDQGMTSLSAEAAQEITESYVRDGYAVVRNALPRERILKLNQAIHDEFARQKESGELFAGGGFISGHINCFPGEDSRYFYDRLQDIGIIPLIRKLLPSATGLPNVACNFNMPGSVAQHYHTDRPFTREFIIINIALVDTVIENGAIDVLPATHKEYVPFWRFATSRLFRKTTRLPMKAGDILIRTSNLWHRGMPNLSDTPRAMMGFTWEDGGSVLEDPFKMDGGRITFRPNWFRPTRLGKLRERIFVKAPLSYSAYRFVDSVLTKKGY